MADVSYVHFHVNGQQTFLVDEKILSRYSGKLRKLINQGKRGKHSEIKIDDFPGGPYGFELVSRFCYNNGSIEITVSNVSLLYCAAHFLAMRENVIHRNLLHQTETFLEGGLFSWPLNDLLICLESCGPILSLADSYGLVQKLICCLLGIIAQNSDLNHLSSLSLSSSLSPSSCSSSSSPHKSCSNWWFDDLVILPPNVIVKLVKTLGAYGQDNNSLVLTRFLLHYLKSASRFRSNDGKFYKPAYSKLADTAIFGVISFRCSFSCRGMLTVLRIVGGFGPSRECRVALESEIGDLLGTATLDDLLVCGRKAKGAYDVDLVKRLLRLYVSGDDDNVLAQNMKRMGKLIDKYLGEIAPDQTLKVSKFLGVAESLPDFARESFDGVYRAIDIYLESHPTLSEVKRSKLCRCLDYAKLSLETSKDLAKNPKIPPRIAIRALVSQHPNILPSTNEDFDKDDNDDHGSKFDNYSRKQIVLHESAVDADEKRKSHIREHEEEEIMKLNLERMQWRVVELEKLCMEMKGQMSRMVKDKTIMASIPHKKFMPKGC